MAANMAVTREDVVATVAAIQDNVAEATEVMENAMEAEGIQIYKGWTFAYG